MARVSLPLFLSRFRTVSPSASRESRYHDTPPAISAAHFSRGRGFQCVPRTFLALFAAVGGSKDRREDADAQRFYITDPIVAHCQVFRHLRFARARSLLPILGDALTFAPYPSGRVSSTSSRLVSPGLSPTCSTLGQWQRSSRRCCFWHFAFELLAHCSCYRVSGQGGVYR